MADNSEWGPLAGLIGEWEGDEGLDISWHNVEGELGETKYREKVSMKPFGPVDNGTQHLYGLDYRMAAWRGDEENPFHTEVGYWLWDGATGEVMRCFMVPRGSTILAGGTAQARRHDRSTLEASCRQRDLRHPVEPVPRGEGAHDEVHVHGHDRGRHVVVRRDHARTTTRSAARSPHTDRNMLRKVD